MAFEHSVTRFIQQLKANEDAALEALWERYFDRIIAVARQRLAAHPKRVADEEDIAAGVMDSLWRGAGRNRFPQLEDRDDLWRVLLTLTRQKVVDYLRHTYAKKRGGGEGGEAALAGEHDSQPAGIDAVAGDAPDPAFVVLLDDHLQHLMECLPNNELRHIAQCRLEGESNQEIAERVGLGLRSIERKLHLIRECWTREKSR